MLFVVCCSCFCLVLVCSCVFVRCPAFLDLCFVLLVVCRHVFLIGVIVRFVSNIGWNVLFVVCCLL